MSGEPWSSIDEEGQRRLIERLDAERRSSPADSGMEPEDSGIAQPWIARLPLKMQTVIFLGTRGPDTHRCPELKKIVRWIRGNVYKPGDPDNPQFMLAGEPPEIVEKQDVARELEFVTQHYYAHLMHVLEIIGYKHPDSEVRRIARRRYEQMVFLFHLNPETEQQLDYRLRLRTWKGGQPMNFEEAVKGPGRVAG